MSGVNPTTTSPQVAIVTGASSGIGRSLVLQLLEDGYSVVANARDEARLFDLGQAAGARRGHLRLVTGDVAEPVTPGALLEAAVESFGSHPVVCIVNAGIGMPGTVLTSDPDKWSELLRVNLYGALHQLRAFAEALTASAASEPILTRARDIVVVGSSIGRNISPANPIYGATKQALHHAAESLRREIGPRGVRVTLIEPGIVGTGFQKAAAYDSAWFAAYAGEVGPILAPEDVANVIRFVISQPAHVHLNEVMMRPTRQSYP